MAREEITKNMILGEEKFFRESDKYSGRET